LPDLTGKPAFKLLNQLQDYYLRMVYSCPPTTPIPALRALAGVWDMEHKVALEKVCLVSDTLHRRGEQNYARELLAEELAQGWPGITMEVKAICRQMGLPDATEKYLYRKEVKEAMSYHHLKIIKEEMEGKSECEKVRKIDTRQMQDFMLEKSLENSRMEVLWLTDMLDTRTTMKAKYKQYHCPHCNDGRLSGTLESPSHLMECDAYSELRKGINPESFIQERPGYLRSVIAKRKELEAKL
jgi:hypothetical protein